MTSKLATATPVEVDAEQMKVPAIFSEALCTWRAVDVNVWITPPWLTSYVDVLMEMLPVDEVRGVATFGIDQATTVAEGSGVENRHDNWSWVSPESWLLTVLPGSWWINCGPAGIASNRNTHNGLLLLSHVTCWFPWHWPITSLKGALIAQHCHKSRQNLMRKFVYDFQDCWFGPGASIWLGTTQLWNSNTDQSPSNRF